MSVQLNDQWVVITSSNSECFHAKVCNNSHSPCSLTCETSQKHRGGVHAF